MTLTWPHIHLMINHFPIVGSIFIFIILAYGTVRKHDSVIKLSLVLWVFTALFTFFVHYSGDRTADMLRHLPGMKKSLIESHDNASMLFLISSEVAGGACLITLWFFRKAQAIPNKMIYGILTLSLAVFGLGAWTANLGGQIRHPEIRPGFKFPLPRTVKTQPE